MSKIIVEDLTKPAESSTEVLFETLSGVLLTTAVKTGAYLRLSTKDILKAILITAEDLINYLYDMEKVPAEEIKKIHEDAKAVSDEKNKKFHESGTADLVKRVTWAIKNKGSDNE